MFVRYPRTRHLTGSKFQHGDHDLLDVSFSELKGEHLVVEEKIDGANAGISFEDGKLMLQSRGHHLRGGPRERHFDLLKQWASARSEELYCALGERYVMFGEWMRAKHTVYYDALPHYFMEFDLYDRHTETFSSTEKRDEIYRAAGIRDVIVPVRVLASKAFTDFGELTSLLGNSAFVTPERRDNFKKAVAGIRGSLEEHENACDWDPLMEGLYVKWEENNIVRGRYKFVRDTFTSSILNQGEHWLNRPIVPNGLVPGAFERMFL